MRYVGITLIVLGVVSGLGMLQRIASSRNWGSTHDISSAAADVLISLLVIVLGQYIMRRNPKI
jgi:hypothetical protein